MEEINCFNFTDFVNAHIFCGNKTDLNLYHESILLTKLGPKRKSLPVVVLLLFIYSLIFLTGVLGNVFTCAVIIRTSYMRTSTNYYLFSLAISDVILLIIGMYANLVIFYQNKISNYIKFS